MQILTINRTGVVETQSTTPNQCKERGHQEYKYKVRVKCSPKLDKKSFLIDHVEIHKRVTKTFEFMDSCEVLCMRVASEVVSMMTKHGCIVREVYVKVKPILDNGQKPLAFMEYEESF